MTENDQITTVLEQVDKAGIAMLVTTEDDGRIVSRPMAVQEVAADHSIWFITRSTGDASQDSKGGQQVNITLANKGFWASVSGTADVVRDDQRKREFWNAGTEAFFGEDASPEDPEIVLIRVQPQSAEYWDSPGAVATVVEMVKGKITGKPANPGENETVQF